jgi:circadian clock protein KaiC
LAAQFCAAACRRGERALYFAFEESEAEIVRNMASVGIELRQWVDSGLLQFHCFRPTVLGLEAHLFAIQTCVHEFDPAVVVKDPVSDLLRVGNGADLSAMLTRQVDFLKARGVTVLFTSLESDGEPAQANQHIASLVDTWLFVKTMEGNGEHNRVLYVLKSRGMAHSNQIREFLLTAQGVELADVYVGPDGVLTGSARQAQEARERSHATERKQGLEQRQADLETRRESVEAQTAVLWREFEDEAEIVRRLLSDGSTGVEDRAGQRAEQGRLRRVDTDEPEYTIHVDDNKIGAS